MEEIDKRTQRNFVYAIISSVTAFWVILLTAIVHLPLFITIPLICVPFLCAIHFTLVAFDVGLRD